jgi:hypothetical protein
MKVWNVNLPCLPGGKGITWKGAMTIHMFQPIKVAAWFRKS